MQFTMRDLAFHLRLGHLLEGLESDGFWPRLAAFLRTEVQFEAWVVLIFRQSHSPLLVHEGDTDYIEGECFSSYLRTYFAEDPFYHFAMGAFSPGIYRLSEVASPHFHASSYFLDYFRHFVGADEVQYLVPFGEGEERRGILSLSLGSTGGFSDADHGLLSLMTPWILPLLSQATRYTLKDTRVPTDRSDHAALGSVEERLRSTDGPRLTEREVQTALLLLAGQSNKGIAAHLGISPETVKVHRRNLYEKLGVSSQAEIFVRYFNA